ncbi:MAG: MmgE/PrpD family protein [Thermoprotei archaeon]
MLADKIADYALSLEYKDLSQRAVHEAKRRIIDTLGVCFPALEAEPVKIARDVAAYSTSRYGATVLGSWVKAPVQEAAFANGCAARYLDYNDTYLSKEAIHPSDNIPSVLAAAEAEGADGQELLLGVVTAYEVACRLADASSIRDRGWDHVTYIAISAAVGAAKVMGLDKHKLVQAVNLAATPNIALRQTRAGELSMWKGCAAANAARNGLFAALLAKHGMSGPSPVFEGEMGFFKQVSGPLELNLGVGEPKLLETHIKYYPVEYHAMSAVDVARRLREKVDPNEVAEIKVDTFSVGWRIIAKDPEKWDPKTKETADHSLPYIVAATLVDGSISLDSYLEWKLRDQSIRRLLGVMKISVDAEFDKMYPESTPVRIKVVTKGGSIYTEEATYPRGHYKNPLSDQEIETKYLRCGGPKDALPTLWSLEKKSVKELVSSIKSL